MIGDLESQEFMDRLKRLCILCRDSDPAAILRLLERIGDGPPQTLKSRDAGGDLIVNEHGLLEVSISEHPGDMGQMHLNLIPCCGVRGVIGFDPDCAAVWK